MKKKWIIIAVISLTARISQAQGQGATNTFPNKGNAGVGTVSPLLDLHINGTNVYKQEIGPGLHVIGPNGPILEGNNNGGNQIKGYQLSTQGGKTIVTYGPTSGILLTNSVSGSTANDGAIVRMSDNNLFIDNYELDGTISIASLYSNMLFHGPTRRIFVGGSANGSNNMAKMNIATEGGENGLFLETVSGYGLGVRVYDNNRDAIRVYSSGTYNKTFKVSGNGEVFARKYTTTLQNIPDYVFAPDYQLMPLGELKNYIEQHKHLPNIPSAKAYEQNGVDLGEMNRLLLEKTEEQTLYILQLEERTKKLEEQVQQLINSQLNEQK